MASIFRTVTNRFLRFRSKPEDLQFPDWIPSPPRPDRDAADRRPRRARNSGRRTENTSEFQVSNFATNKVIPLVYGRRNIGAKFLARPIIYQDLLILACGWCYGEIEEIEEILFDNKPMPSNITATHYVGAYTQTVDPTLVQAFAAEGITFADDFVVEQPLMRNFPVGISYSVLQIPNSIDKWPNISAILKGRKVYDPRDAGAPNEIYSRNPALICRDWFTIDNWGPVFIPSFETTNLEAMADYLDEDAGINPRACLDITIDGSKTLEEMMQEFAAYCRCRFHWFPSFNYEIEFLIDKPSVSVYTFNESNTIKNSFKFLKESSNNRPNRIEVYYTKVIETLEKKEWVDSSPPAIVIKPDFSQQADAVIESVVQMPGITRHGEAYNVALRRYNEIALTDLAVRIVVADIGVILQEIDTVTVDHHILGGPKLMRVVNKQQVSINTWALDLYEYDPAVWSDNIEDEPTYTDTSYLDANNPSEVVAMSATEDVIKRGDRFYESRIYISWTTLPVWPFLRGIDIKVFDGNDVLVHSAVAAFNDVEYYTPPLKEKDENDIYITYTVQVRTMGNPGILGTIAKKTVELKGKSVVPTDVEGLVAATIGGSLWLKWDAAFDIDLIGYDVRYGAVSVSWANATREAFVDSTTYFSSVVPPGTYDFLVKAIDSGFRESTNVARITVTLDEGREYFIADRLFVDSRTATSPEWVTSFQMLDYPELTNHYGLFNETWNNAFTSNMSTYTNEILTYSNSPSIQYIDEPNFTYVGNWLNDGGWSISGGVASISGTANKTLYQNLSLVSDNTHLMLFEIKSYVSGSVTIVGNGLKNHPIVELSENGYKYAFVTGNGGTQSVGIKTHATNGFSGSIDNFYVYSSALFYESEILDVGAVVTGKWKVDWRGLQEFGTVLKFISVNDSVAADPEDWRTYNLDEVEDTARHMKINLACLADGRNYIVKHPVDFTEYTQNEPEANLMTVQVETKEENFSGTSSASAGVTINLTKPFFKFVSIVVSVEQTTATDALTYSFSDYVTGSSPSFKVHVYNTSGTRQARDFIGTVLGV